MQKRIVLCTDGTWDKETNHTNVYRLSQALAVSAEQIGFYDDGVGADGLPIDRLAGGAFGLGLFNKIKQGYTQVAHVYEAGDELFLFGFSRGAYTARSIAGMIAICGLPTKNFDNDLVDIAFQAYRQKDQRPALLAELNKNYAIYDAKITMVGVWDTVGSLGIPAIFGGVGPVVYGFLDTSLHPDVLNAYHAVAIDERRAEFPPSLWTTSSTSSQKVEQVWFCGVHSVVGGGEPPDQSASSTLSDITLAWMMDKACALGLELDGDVEKQYLLPLDPKYSLDTLHSSWNPLWGFPRARLIADDASIADSVVVRCEHHDGWQPKNLKLVGGVPSANYGIVHVVSPPATAAAAVAVKTIAAA
ncbi:MAG: DUF2235 domain-containing protein [Bryobacteraceae bacterium]